jgi:putative FmdB family regulatory protein
MPLYEYECESCKHKWEENKKMSAAKTTTCPECKEEKAKRLISLSAFQLKGSGWFKSGGY